MEYVGRVRKALLDHVGSINFIDSANIRQVHEALMCEVRKKSCTLVINTKLK